MNNNVHGLITLLVLIGSTPALADSTLPLPNQTVDISPPTIEHAPNSEDTASGKAAIVSATVTDIDSGVKVVSLFFRTKGTSQYNRLPMESKDGSANYIAEIPERYVQDPGVEYYIEAVDNVGNKILRGVNFSPLLITVAPTSAPEHGLAGIPTGSDAESSPAAAMSSAESQSNKKTWLYIAGGVVVTGVLLANTGGSDKNKSDTGSVTIKAPAP